MKLAPIALFTYNRLWHTQQTVEALLQNELASESDLIIYSDGPKNDRDKKKVDEVRQYIHTIEGFNSIFIVESEKNNGLGSSIIKGVTDVVNKYGRIIVLEDDLVTSPYFLRYMNDALELYQNEEKVISIHGYVLPVFEELPTTFFIRGADCWGWATWKRGWDLFEEDGRKLLDELKKRKLTKQFDYNGAYRFIRMLKDQIAGNNSSWAIRWFASVFLHDGLILYPGVSLVQNIGADGSGTHFDLTHRTNKFDVELSDKPITLEKIETLENQEARRAITNYRRFIKTPFLIALWRRGKKYLIQIINRFLKS